MMGIESEKCERKKLVINDVMYAEYETQIVNNRDTIFIKVRKEIIPGDEGGSEDLLIDIISLIEQKSFYYSSFLNIK